MSKYKVEININVYGKDNKKTFDLMDDFGFSEEMAIDTFSNELMMEDAVIDTIAENTKTSHRLI